MSQVNDAGPDSAATGELCKYCGMVDCPMHGKTSAEASVGQDPGVHTMAGIPPHLAVGSLVAIILLSHIFFSRKRLPLFQSFRWNILSLAPVGALVKKSFFPILMSGFSIILFILVLLAGFWGSQRVNIGPVITWTWWWALLVFMVLFLGKFFCSICPWEGISALVTSLSIKSRIKKMGFEIPWPKGFRNIYPALFLFILLTWLELGLEVTRSPYATAVMGAGFVGLAVLTALIFERRAFCRYLCLVGRIQGIYALFSPVELRPGSASVCATCTNKECYHGSADATGCPTSLFPGSLKENTYCTLCTECVRSCPEDNIEINVRPFGEDLAHKSRFRMDEAVLAVVLLALTSFHGLTMTPEWQNLTDWLRVSFDMGLRPVFTILMALMIAAPVGLFLAAAKLSKLVSGTQAPWITIFKAFSYSLIPIALFYHLAHNSMHFFMEAQYIVPLLSDPFGRGWDLFGTAGKTYLPLLTINAIWWIQIILIVAGHVFGVVAAERIASKVYDSRKEQLVGLIPLIFTMILYSAFSVWLIAQPMEMRSGM